MTGSLLAMDFDQISGTQLAIVAAICIVVIVYLWSRKPRSTEPSPKPYRRELDTAARDIHGLQAELEHLVGELERVSQRIAEEAGARKAEIDAAIVEADERIATLRALLERPAAIDRSAGSDRTASRAGTLPTVTPPSLLPPLTPLGPVPGTTTPIRDVQTAKPTPGEDRHRPVYTLADEGLTSVEIAQRLGQRVGEIELILNLRPKQNRRTDRRG